jgi:hypothetical protein
MYKELAPNLKYFIKYEQLFHGENMPNVPSKIYFEVYSVVGERASLFFLLN